MGENVYQLFLDRGLISRICKEPKKLSIKEQRVQSVTGEMNREFSNRKVQADNKCMRLGLVTTCLSSQRSGRGSRRIPSTRLAYKARPCLKHEINQSSIHSQKNLHLCSGEMLQLIGFSDSVLDC